MVLPVRVKEGVLLGLERGVVVKGRERNLSAVNENTKMRQQITMVRGNGGEFTVDLNVH